MTGRSVYFSAGAWALAFSLASPAAALAGPREDLGNLAAAVAGLGHLEEASELQAAVDSTTDEELDTVFSEGDVAPLIHSVQDLQEPLSTLRGLFRHAEPAALAAAQRMVGPRPTFESVMSGAGGPLEIAAYPQVAALCPFHVDLSVSPARRSDTRMVFEELRRLTIARKVLEQVEIIRNGAKGVADGLSRLCATTRTVFGVGGNFSVVCIPVDIAFAIVEFAVAEALWTIELLQGLVDVTLACDDAVDTAEIAAIYERSDHIHDDLDRFKAEEQVVLDRMQAKLDLVLKIHLENDLARGSGARTSVDYVTRMDEVEDAVQEAIEDAHALGYRVSLAAQQWLDSCKLTRRLSADPKKAFDECQRAYKFATSLSNRLR